MHILYTIDEVIDMAEICLECWNKISETQESKWRYILSWDEELCEECGQYKRVIVAEWFWSRTQRSLAEMIGNIKNHNRDNRT